MQTFLDENQYSKNGIHRYEWLFGKHFISTGGFTHTKEFVSSLDLQPGERVLDVGSGLGGHAFHMAEVYGVSVVGVDLSKNMHDKSVEYLATEKKSLRNLVEFQLCDITNEEFEAKSFDLIYSRDCFMHIGDKEALFKKFMTWLKPGGRIFFTDYFRGNDNPSEEFCRYISERGYHMITLNQYEKVLTDAGFSDVCVTELSSKFMESLLMEYNKLVNERDIFLQKFTLEDLVVLLSGWHAKIIRLLLGDQIWLSGYGRKSEADNPK